MVPGVSNDLPPLPPWEACAGLGPLRGKIRLSFVKALVSILAVEGALPPVPVAWLVIEIEPAVTVIGTVSVMVAPVGVLGLRIGRFRLSRFQGSFRFYCRAGGRDRRPTHGDA